MEHARSVKLSSFENVVERTIGELFARPPFIGPLHSRLKSSRSTSTLAADVCRHTCFCVRPASSCIANQPLFDVHFRTNADERASRAHAYAAGNVWIVWSVVGRRLLNSLVDAGVLYPSERSVGRGRGAACLVFQDEAIVRAGAVVGWSATHGQLCLTSVSVVMLVSLTTLSVAVVVCVSMAGVWSVASCGRRRARWNPHSHRGLHHADLAGHAEEQLELAAVYLHTAAHHAGLSGGWRRCGRVRSSAMAYTSDRLFGTGLLLTPLSGTPFVPLTRPRHARILCHRCRSSASATSWSQPKCVCLHRGQLPPTLPQAHPFSAPHQLREDTATGVYRR